MAQDVLVSRAVVCATVDKHMLKITKQTETAGLIRLNLHGAFTGEYVSEVEKALSENDHNGDKVALDLRNVTFVDRAAMEFLSKATSRNVSIENTPSYVKRWIEQQVS